MLGRNALDGRTVIIKKSYYQGAVNEGTPDQMRQYNKSDVLKAFKEATLMKNEIDLKLKSIRLVTVVKRWICVNVSSGHFINLKNTARFQSLYILRCSPLNYELQIYTVDLQ